jgi:hypothetical protein
MAAPRSSTTLSTPITARSLKYGVNGYSRETCWEDYRLGMLQAPLITTLGWAFSAVTDPR